jgi:phage gp29-like protein
MGGKRYKNKATTPSAAPNVAPETPAKVWVKDYIAPVAVQRLKQDIGKWRLAVQEAENPVTPQRYMMQQMYLDTVLNGHVTACINKRYANILKKGIEVVNDNGDVNEELTKLYNKKWMFDILRHTLDAQMYGYTLIQLGDMKNYEFEQLYTIRRANVNPEKEIVTKDAYAIDGISIKDPQYDKNLIWVKTASEVGAVANWGKCGYGLLYKVAPYEIWYKQAISLWNEYQQLFGMPLRIGKTDVRNEQMRNQMSDMLANMGAAGWAVVDKDDIIELVDSGNMTGGNEVYLTMVDKLEKIISKIILGHADALDSVPGKLGATQGEESPAYLAMKDIEAFDCQFLEFELEKNIVPKLVGMGFPMPAGYNIKFVNSYEKMEARAKEDQNNKFTADMVKVLFDAGLKVDAKWLSERTGIPVEEKPEPKPEAKVMKAMIKERMQLKNAVNDLYGGCKHDHE